jgi:hypothetical protein
MSVTFARHKAWLVPAIVGALSPYVVLRLWLELVGIAWMPLIRYLTDVQGMAVRSALDLAWLFDGLFGILCGVAIALLVSLFIRVKPMQSWLVLMAAFFLAVFIPDALELGRDELRFFVWHPLVVAFAGASLVALWMRRGANQHAVAP